MEAETKNLIYDIARKLPCLFLGFIFCATGIISTYYAGLGMNPWGVLHAGITNYTPLTFGQVTQLVGLIILILSSFLGSIPGLGSILNMLFIGMFYDIIDNLGIFSTPDSFMGKLLMLFFGIFMLGWGTYFYLRVQLGAGPRDGLMEGLVKKLSKPVWMIRGSIECIALLVGYFLGGPVGIGTLIIAVTIGFSVQTAFRIGRYDSKNSTHLNCLELYKKLKENPLGKATYHYK